MCKRGEKKNYICMCLYLTEDTIWKDAEETNKSGYLLEWARGADGRVRYILRLFNIYLFILFDF